MDKNEAIKIVREAHDKALFSVRTALETLIPELKESEDERIRKEMIHFLKSEKAFQTIDLPVSERWIAYLEKQKEQKPIAESKRLANEVIKYLTKCGYSPVLRDDSKKEHFHIDIPRHKDDFWQSEEYKHCRSLLGEYYMEGDYGGDTYTLYIWRAKKEQKPAEWTIDDAKPGDVLNSTRVQATIIYKGKADDGKHILAYCALQKGFFISQEMLWDKDFELASEYWKNALYEAIVRKGYSWDADRLEFEKKEGKPAEWSEEDEKMIERLIRHTQKEWDELCKDKYGHQEIISDLKESCRERMNWLENRLKSLRPQPHWKPSEEQMKALNAIACTGELSYSGQEAQLISLKNDLKKLM